MRSPTVRVLTIAVICLTVLFVPGAERATAATPASSFYSSIFPALTPNYAAYVQSLVDHGQLQYLRQPGPVGEAFARFMGWPLRAGTTRVTRLNASRAAVSVARRDTSAFRLYMYLARLGRQQGGIWSVTGCYTTNLKLSTPTTGQSVRSPVTVSGVAAVFEGRFELAMFGIGWKRLGAKVVQIRGMERTPFTTSLAFLRQDSYGVIKASSRSPKDGSLLDLDLVKVGL